MATFISTFRFTEKGIQAIRDTAKRAAAFKARSPRRWAIKVINVYWTLGTFDGLLIFDAPNDETATAAMLQLASAGNVHTSTCRAFDAGEIEKVIGMMGK